MIRTKFPHSGTIRRASVALIGLVSFVAACESAESKRMKAMAGNYVWEYETDPATDPSHVRVHERHTLTLSPDGSWSTNHLAELNGEASPVQRDGGTYRVQGVTLSLSPTESQPAMQYTISGDTLWIRAAAAMALGKAVTSIDMPPGEHDTSFLVRQR